MAVRRRDMGDAWGRRSVRGSMNEVGDDLHRETAGNRGTVGGTTPTICSVYKGEMLRRGWAQ